MAKMRPPISPEAEEQQMISLAMSQARKELEAGTASSQIVVHFLKLATTKEQLQNDKLREENELLKAKTEQIQRQERIEELYADAIKAMKNYAGQGDPDEY